MIVTRSGLSEQQRINEDVGIHFLFFMIIQVLWLWKQTFHLNRLYFHFVVSFNLQWGTQHSCSLGWLLLFTSGFMTLYSFHFVVVSHTQSTQIHDLVSKKTYISFPACPTITNQPVSIKVKPIGPYQWRALGEAN